MADRFRPPVNVMGVFTLRHSGIIGKIVWASPNTLLGIGIGLIGLLTRGRVRRVGHTLEFYGGFVRWFLKHGTLLADGASAMTLGHTILGQTPEDLDFCREHELVHVRQYERWGPFFLPAYLGCSFYLWFRGKNFYLDNPFEVEAYRWNDPHADN